MARRCMDEGEHGFFGFDGWENRRRFCREAGGTVPVSQMPR